MGATGLPWDTADAVRTPLSSTEVDDLVAVATTLADVAGNEALRHFRRPDLVATNKDETGWDPVTQADRAAEAAMRKVLAARRPADGIVGEEGDHAPGTSGLTWVLDPIDGTRAFLAGLPTWGVLVALFDGIEPVIGVIAQPHVGERWVGVATGDRCDTTLHRDGVATPLRARTGVALDAAILSSTFPEVGTRLERRAFEVVRDRAMLTRYGADCYAYALVASGTVDVVVEAGLSPWDVQALVPVVRGAGGVVTTWDGGAAHAGGRIVAAGSAALHHQVVTLLSATHDAG